MVAKFWFPLQIAAPERGTESQSETKLDNCIDAAVSALLPPQVLDALHIALNETAHRLRNLLHQGELKAYYFGSDGRHSVSRDFWATTDADEVMESGIYWPFGKSPQLAPNYLCGLLRNYPLFLPQTELDVLLSEQPGKKRPLPREKVPELAAALRKLDHLPNRLAQLQALREMPEFREFIITHAVFREVTKWVGPRPAGRKSRRES
jgi:hypothetical protein